MDKPEKKKKGIGNFIIFTLIYAIFLMWLVGTLSHYYPAPVHVGGGQYFDLSIGAVIIGGSIFIMLAAILYKKINKK